MHDLIKLAKEAIALKFGRDFKVSEQLKQKYNSNNGIFVTLKIDNELRGCIGFISSQLPLYESVIEASQNAAFDDPRFAPLTADEFQKINIEISILSPLREIKSKNSTLIQKEIVIGKHGLIIKKGINQGLLLPQVATEYKWDVDEFLKHTCEKAGLAPNTWKEDSFQANNCSIQRL